MLHRTRGGRGLVSFSLFALISVGCGGGGGGGWQNDYDTFLAMIKIRAQSRPHAAVNPDDYRSKHPTEALAPFLMIGPPQNSLNMIFDYTGPDKQPNGPEVHWEGPFRAIKSEGGPSLNSIVGPKFPNIVEFDLTTEYQSKHSFSSDKEGATKYHVVFLADEKDIAAWSQSKAGEAVKFTARLGTILIEGADRSEVGVRNHAYLVFRNTRRADSPVATTTVPAAAAATPASPPPPPPPPVAK